MSSTERNLHTSRRWLLDVFNNHDLAAVPEIVAGTYTNHGTTALTGVEAGRAVITQADSWAPDRRIDITYMAAQDDLVAVLFLVTGTHTGPFMGLPATNRRLSVHLADFFRFNEEGKMVEGWVIGQGDLRLALEALVAESKHDA
jgi:predicted ester cyclase